MHDLLHIYIEKYLDGTLSPDEEVQLDTMLLDESYMEEFSKLLSASFHSQQSLLPEFISIRDRNYKELCAKFNIADNAEVAHRVHFLKAAWFRYAAAVILLFGSAVYFWNTNKKTDQPIVSLHKPLQKDIAPGGNRAILTLADGRTIVLDSSSNGELAEQGNAQVVKLANGEIVYNVKGLSENEVMWNTMSTPIGGQYQVILPDGTKVWLNAASSITYPAVFVGKERQVKITGEVYFEVAKNKERPFIVDIDGKSSVEVLGTCFNINSYKDEEDIKTTLLEGSVKISSNNKQAILKPGEQASTGNTAGIIVKSDINLVQTLAWKNGIFDFTGADVKALMRQLERWYGIKVQYKGTMSNMTFDGGMYRNANLSDVLKMLKKWGIRFELEGINLMVY